MSTNEITGDRVSTKIGDAEAKRRFDESFERIFGPRPIKAAPTCARCGSAMYSGLNPSDYCAECGRPE